MPIRALALSMLSDGLFIFLSSHRTVQYGAIPRRLVPHCRPSRRSQAVNLSLPSLYWSRRVKSSISTAEDRFPQGMSRTQLAKQHGHELIPAAEALSAPFRIQGSDGRIETIAIHQIQDLRKTAGNAYHDSASVFVSAALTAVRCGCFGPSTSYTRTEAFR